MKVKLDIVNIFRHTLDMKTQRHTVTLQEVEAACAERQEISICGQWGTVDDKKQSKELFVRVYVLDASFSLSKQGPQYVVKHHNEIVMITWNLREAIEEYNSL
jgi:hypothetical protein